MSTVGCGGSSTKVENSQAENQVTEKETVNKEEKHMVMVGKEAPKFTAPAFYKGEMTSVNLEDYRGQWVLLCFYPGDFTFV